MFRGKIFGLLLCLLIGLSAVGMADGYTFEMNDDAVVKVSGGENTVTEMVIPSSVRRFNADLSEYQQLKYIKFDAASVLELPHFSSDLLSQVDNLEAIYFTFSNPEAKRDQINDIIEYSGTVPFFAVTPASDRPLSVSTPPTYADNKVTFTFENLGNDVWYIVIRGDGNLAEVFDSRSDFSHFSTDGSGSMTFTDKVGAPTQERTYQYTIETHALFHNNVPILRDTTFPPINIPAYVPDAPTNPTNPSNPTIPSAPSILIPAAPSLPPATGDATPTLMLAVLMAASAAVCVFSALRMKKKTNG